MPLAGGAGMREYFDPLTGDRRGSDEFSSTAAVLIDPLERRGG